MSAPLRLTDRKRQAILDAAVAAFREHGFEATSMDRIAALAGVSKRTVYNHFPSKDELFLAIIQCMMLSKVAAVELSYTPAQPLGEQLVALLRQKLRMLSDPNVVDIARVATAEAIRSPARARELVARLGEKEEAITAWVRAAQQDGRLQAGDPAFMATLLHGQLKGQALFPQIMMGRPPLSPDEGELLVQTLAGMFLAYFAKASA
ncbi:TetR/AcrR family transcriptional regulator [Massilia sp. TS11]|uniref:TetR/AcrR family transcriptional regulator n=1 Tax=Massilia sp. TS11 TaxID=2908003 RepID=UPI001EDA7E72|nr:TetR/AcrR family transcriptional regulator [Massilia sp. TS11]MCG2585794.1 TetR/AcrR family transcriptional regulator [Massilia sp. TS11]